MTARVAAIFLAAGAGERLVPVETAVLESGKGLLGDRYYLQAGTFSEKLKDGADWEVTLIETEEIQRYNASQGIELSPGAFRRNIVTQGIRLNDLEGKRFRVGAALLEGIRLCEPCAHLGSFLGTIVVKAMAHRAGLRAKIVKSAIIRPGDPVGLISGGCNDDAANRTNLRSR